MTDHEIMRQLSKAVRDDNLLAAGKMVTTGQQWHLEWNWPLLATVLWIQRGQMQNEPELLRQPAWRRWLRWLVNGSHRLVRTGLALRAPRPGTLPGRGPAGCLLDGLPPSLSCP